MTYKVIGRSVETQEIIDFVDVDNWDEAADLSCNWQAYYDDCYEWQGEEVIVSVEVYDEKGVLIDG